MEQAVQSHEGRRYGRHCRGDELDGDVTDGTGSGAGGTAGNGGAGVVGSGLTIINRGTINGGTGGSGGSSGNAITFTGGTNTLELHASSTITGNVVALGTNDTLILGGSTDSTFDSSTIGFSGKYQRFENFTKTGTSNWTLTGTGIENWTISDGTLTVSSTSLGTGYVTNSSSLVFDQSTTISAGTLQIGNGGTTAPSAFTPNPPQDGLPLSRE